MYTFVLSNTFWGKKYSEFNSSYVGTYTVVMTRISLLLLAISSPVHILHMYIHLRFFQALCVYLLFMYFTVEPICFVCCVALTRVQSTIMYSSVTKEALNSSDAILLINNLRNS